MTDLNALKYTAEHEWIAFDGDVATDRHHRLRRRQARRRRLRRPARRRLRRLGRPGLRRDRVDEVGRRALRAADRRGRRGQRRRRRRPVARQLRPVRRRLAHQAPRRRVGGRRAARPRRLRRAHGRRGVSARGFAERHIGTDAAAQRTMLDALGYADVDALVQAAVPASIHVSARSTSDIPPAATEAEALAELRALASQNRVARPMIGLGYYDTFTPSVIARNVLENPSWYTAYTPYQPEISQGRLEALINFQTMVTDLTGLDDRERVDARRVDRRRRGDAGRPPRLEVRRRTSSSSTPTRCRRPRRCSSTAPRRVGIELVELDFAAGGAAARRGVRRVRAVPGCLRPRVGSVRRHRRRARRGRRSSSSPPICSRSRCCARPARSAPTSRSARPSASACRSASAARTPATWRCAPGSSGSCPAASSACRRMRPATRPTVSRCRRASSTSAARRRPRTSAPRRCCWPSWRRCTPSTTAPTGLHRDRDGCRAQGRGARRAAALVRPLARDGLVLRHDPRRDPRSRRSA